MFKIRYDVIDVLSRLKPCFNFALMISSAGLNQKLIDELVVRFTSMGFNPDGVYQKMKNYKLMTNYDQILKDFRLSTDRDIEQKCIILTPTLMEEAAYNVANAETAAKVFCSKDALLDYI